MRERIKDKGRLEHILNSIDVLLSNQGKYEYADVDWDVIEDNPLSLRDLGGGYQLCRNVFIHI